MRIHVEVSEWDQACCGAAFRTGDDVTWTLLAADPALTPPGGLARFLREHHDGAPDDVPHWDVTGTVRAITGVTYPELPVAGEPRSFILDTQRPLLTALSEVEQASSAGFSEYLVEIDVVEDCALPVFVLNDSIRERRLLDLRDAQRDRTRMQDRVGAVLEMGADYAETSFGSVARIVRDRRRSAITIEPHRDGATTVWWARSNRDADGIDIHVGNGSWRLPATVEKAELVTVFLDAAAAGRVTEEVIDEDGASKRLDTCVRSGDGRQWVSSEHFEPVIADSGMMLVLGDVWQRVQRGNRAYAPWDPEAQCRG